MSDFTRGLQEHLSIGSPLVFCETTEDNRLLDYLSTSATEAGSELWVWSPTTGLRRRVHKGDQWEHEPVQVGDVSIENFEALVAGLVNLTHAERLPEHLVVHATDAVSERQQDSLSEPRNVRLLKDLHGLWEPWAADMKQRQTLVFSGVGWSIPSALAGYCAALPLPLMSREELARHPWVAGSSTLERHGVAPRNFAERAVGISDAALSPLMRRLALLEPGSEQVWRLIDHTKEDEVRRTGVLESQRPPTGVKLGGYGRFRQWFERRCDFFVQPKNDSLRPRGVLLLGFPGCGKSLAAKWIAQTLRVPLVTMDVGRLQDRWVGASEARMRLALRTLEATSPCVLFIDEIEKAIAGTGSESSGVTTRLVGQLLTWLADHREPIFIVATCNRIVDMHNRSNIPPELTRAGRFDARFVVPLPEEHERPEILQAVVKQLGLTVNPDVETRLLALVRSRSAAYSGAELRQILVEAAYAAGNGCALEPRHVDAVIDTVQPMSCSEEGKRLKEAYEAMCAAGGAMRASYTADEQGMLS